MKKKTWKVIAQIKSTNHIFYCNLSQLIIAFLLAHAARIDVCHGLLVSCNAPQCLTELSPSNSDKTAVTAAAMQIILAAASLKVAYFFYLHLLCGFKEQQSLPGFVTTKRRFDWFWKNKTVGKHFQLELGKMNVQDFRVKISAIQLHSNIRKFSMLRDGSKGHTNS